MAEANVLSETPISMGDLKEELIKIKKRDKELNFRANKTEEYLNQFVASKKEKELVEALTKLNVPRLKEQHMKKIADLLPRTIDDLKVILQGYPISINNENLKKIADTVNKFTGA